MQELKTNDPLKSTGMMERQLKRSGPTVAALGICPLLAFLLNAFLLVPLFGDLQLQFGQAISLFVLLSFGFRAALISALAAGIGFWWSTGFSLVPIAFVLAIQIGTCMIDVAVNRASARLLFWLTLVANSAGGSLGRISPACARIKSPS